jgi:hypothetical protein
MRACDRVHVCVCVCVCVCALADSGHSLLTERLIRTSEEQCPPIMSQFEWNEMCTSCLCVCVCVCVFGEGGRAFD